MHKKSYTPFEKLLIRLTVSALVGLLITGLFDFEAENWYARYNLLRPVNELVGLKLVSLPGIFSMSLIALGVVVYASIIRGRSELPKLWWLVYVLAIVANALYEISQLLWPTYKDNVVVDIIAGTIGAVLSFVYTYFSLTNRGRVRS
jgi:hypothetical protein